MTSIPNPSTAGETVTVTAVVSPAARAASPTGDVTFLDGSTVLGTAPLDAASTATFTTTGLTSFGPHSLTAAYAGDAFHAPSTSAPLEHLVVAPTATAVTWSPAAPGAGAPVTFTATVTAAPASGTPTGTVTFYEDGEPFGTGSLDAAAQATFTGSFLSGTYAITASYGGDTTHLGSATSAPQDLVVAAGDTATSLVASESTTTATQPFTLTATVLAVPPAGGIPTGAVEFYDGPTLLGTASLDPSGLATLAVTRLPIGTQSLTASYLGSGDFGTSSSSSVPHVDGVAVLVIDAPAGNYVVEAFFSGTAVADSSSSSPVTVTATPSVPTTDAPTDAVAGASEGRPGDTGQSGAGAGPRTGLPVTGFLAGTLVMIAALLLTAGAGMLGGRPRVRRRRR